MKMTQRKPLLERLQQGLSEGAAHARGEITLRTTEVPEAAPEIDGETLAALRTQAAMSQRIFARMLNVATKTLQSWEQGVRQPSDASRRLLQVFCEEPEVMCRIVGLPEVHLAGVEMKVLPTGVRKIVVKARAAGSRRRGKKLPANH